MCIHSTRLRRAGRELAMAKEKVRRVKRGKKYIAQTPKYWAGGQTTRRWKATGDSRQKCRNRGAKRKKSNQVMREEQRSKKEAVRNFIRTVPFERRVQMERELWEKMKKQRARRREEARLQQERDRLLRRRNERYRQQAERARQRRPSGDRHVGDGK